MRKKNQLPTGTFPMDLSNGASAGRFNPPAKRGGKKNTMPTGTFPMDLANGKGSKGRFSPNK